MLSVSVLVCLLLPVFFAGGSTAQQDLLCTDSYAEFESASVGSNVSASNIRNQLYRAFYPPNQHLPYSVLVTYQLVLANESRFNLSSDQDCSTELWVWLSSPVFLIGDTTCLSHMLLFTLNYFVEWNPPHITITMTTTPCPDKIGEFLSEMTASVGLYDQCLHMTQLNQSRADAQHSICTTDEILHGFSWLHIWLYLSMYKRGHV